MLKIQGLCKTFAKGTINERAAITELELNLDEGDFLTVIGGNGAGKSTLLNLICGAILPDSGKIIIDGTDVTHMKEHKRASFLGRVFQDPMLGTAAKMELEENLALAFRRGEKRRLNWGVSKEDRQLFFDELLALDLGLETRLKSKVGLLSGGQRQAITLLMATLKKPKLLLLDEHTAALDPKTAAKVSEITQRITSANKLTTVMVTHNMRDAIRYGNKLIMMQDGKIIFSASGEEKQRLTVATLLEKFGSDAPVNDKLVLG